MTDHTPTPWAIDPDHRPGMGWNNHIVEADDPNNRVCFMTSGPEGVINAAFIIKAANNHNALVKALEDLLMASAAIAEWHANWDVPFADEIEWGGDAKRFRDMRKAARDALNVVSTLPTREGQCP